MLAVLAQSSSDSAGGGGLLIGAILVSMALFVVMLVAYWKVFTKLGLPGWMGIVPIVNVYMVYKARGERDPVLWTILSFIPCVSIVAWWFVCSDTAEMFDKELGWKLFLFLLPGFGHLVLGFGDSQANSARMAAGVGLNDTATS